jgi:hypothetical protein
MVFILVFVCCQDGVMSAGGGDGGDSHSRESRSKLLSDSSGTKRVQPGTTGSGTRVLGTTGNILFSLLFPF